MKEKGKGERSWFREDEQIGRRGLGAEVPEVGLVKELESGCRAGEEERKMEERACVGECWGLGTYGVLALGWPQRWSSPCCAEENSSPKRANGCPVPHGSRGAGGHCRTVMEGGGETEWRSPGRVRQVRGRKRVKRQMEE